MTLDAFLIALLIAGAAGYALLAGRLARASRLAHRRVAFCFALVCIWVAGGALQLISAAPLAGAAARLAHFVGAALLPLAVLVSVRGYIGRPMRRATAALLALVPLATVVLAATGGWHHWLWSAGAAPFGQGPARPAEWGPWFLYVHAPWSYTLLAAAVLALVLHSTAVAPANRRVVLLLAATVALPSAALVAHDFALAPAVVSSVPLMFVVLLPVFAWLVFREQIVEFAPLAYETVFQNMRDPVIVVDDRQRIIGLNYGAESLLRVRESDALRASLNSLFGSEVPEVYAALDSGEPQKMLTTSGRFLHLQASPLAGDGRRRIGGQVLMFRDVSDVEQAQQEVRSSEKLLRTLIDHSVNGVVRLRWTTEDGCRRLRCVFANGAAGRFLCTNPDLMLNRAADEIILLACSGMNRDHARTIVDKFMNDTTQGEVIDIETRVEVRGDSKWLRVIGEPVGDNVAVTFVDVTDRKAKELQMESIAWSDPLTGVLNRRGFERDAARRLSESDDLASGALFFIDLNDFKQINDRCGHEVGDRLLTIVADRLRKTLRSCDIIGRPGGDEFVALVPDVQADLAESLAGRLTETLEQPYRIGEAQLNCAASIGMALYPQHANTLTGLMRAADQAMYRAKARCRGVTAIRRRDLFEKAG
ncbi:MAG: diguanylate cyclase [Woeseiaceae bacterium]|nr:diguanylate cyclase [Woeseiaceae bacterium]